MTIRAFYDDYDEDARVPETSLEWLRNTELIARILPPAPARVADIAGGTGPYALWLAGLGHEVDLLDFVPRHVAAATTKADAAGAAVTAVVGDARALPWPDATFDAALLMGALYHLQDRTDRVRALAEARRALKPGAPLAAVHIGRWASLGDGFARGYIADPRFAAIVADDLATGRHENPDAKPGWFTTAYFHRPEEILAEHADAGLRDVQLLAVQGFASVVDAGTHLATPEGRDRLLAHIRATEAEPALLGASMHLMALSVA